MLLKITKCTDKSNDWKIVDVETPTGEKTVDVSVNRVNKKGEVFPAFDEIKVDHRLNATLWVSSSGKAYLFEPKPESAPKSNFGGSGASKLMDKKIEAIEKSQDVKSEAIKLTTSMQLAVSLAIAEYANPKSLDTLETLITKYRKFILENWEVDITDTQPF